GGHGGGAGGARIGTAALPADPHDRIRVHPRRGAADEGERRGGGGAERDGYRGLLRHADRDNDGRLPHPGQLRLRRRPGKKEEDEPRGRCPGSSRARASTFMKGSWGGGRVAHRSRWSRPHLIRSQHDAKLALAIALSVSLSACAVGPNYTRPAVQTPAGYRGAEGPADVKSLADLPWFDVFRDPTLKGLVEEALVPNYDARIAAARVEQARYVVGVTRADLMPQADYTGSAERGKFFVPGTPNRTSNVFLGAFQMAWEIDVWGR